MATDQALTFPVDGYGTLDWNIMDTAGGVDLALDMIGWVNAQDNSMDGVIANVKMLDAGGLDFYNITTDGGAVNLGFTGSQTQFGYANTKTRTRIKFKTTTVAGVERTITMFVPIDGAALPGVSRMFAYDDGYRPSPKGVLPFMGSYRSIDTGGFGGTILGHNPLRRNLILVINCNPSGTTDPLASFSFGSVVIGAPHDAIMMIDPGPNGLYKSVYFSGDDCPTDQVNWYTSVNGVVLAAWEN